MIQIDPNVTNTLHTTTTTKRPRLAALYSSLSNEWYTPWQYVRALEQELGIRFTLDPACTRKSAKAPKYYTKRGLQMPWAKHVVFLNRPTAAKSAIG